MSYRSHNYETLAEWIARLPIGQYYEVSSSGDSLRIQAATQAKATAIRACFPGVIWKKQHNEGLDWWEYDGTYQGIQICIYACREAPPTCRAIDEEYEAEELVPIGKVEYEKRIVTKKRIRWECDDNGETETI